MVKCSDVLDLAPKAESIEMCYCHLQRAVWSWAWRAVIDSYLLFRRRGNTRETSFRIWNLVLNFEICRPTHTHTHTHTHTYTHTYTHTHERAHAYGSHALKFSVHRTKNYFNRSKYFLCVFLSHSKFRTSWYICTKICVVGDDIKAFTLISYVYNNSIADMLTFELAEKREVLKWFLRWWTIFGLQTFS